jgi:small conductance mechanosensitive channel
MSQLSWESIQPLLVTYGASVGLALLNIVLIVIGGWIAGRFVRKGLERLAAMLLRLPQDEDISSEATEKRVRTLTGLLGTIAKVSIWGIVVVVILTEIGVEIAPILAGAGIAGLAVGFGAQNLVRDVISGFFIVLENQVRIGDVAIINGTGGLVESISFRTMVLRDLSGVVHVFPNGAISSLANMTKGWSAFVLNMGIAYEQDTDEAVEVMKEVHAEMREDPEWGKKLISDIEVFGVDDFGESSVTIKVRLKTLPIHQWSVGREYRRRLKKAFDQRGIVIPFPQRTLHFAGQPPVAGAA